MIQPPLIGTYVNTRRGLLAGLGATVAVGGLMAGHWFNVGAEIAAGAMSVEDAHVRAMKGEIVLVDIRRPDEWARTGIGEGAHPLDMRRDDFMATLLDLAGDKGAAVALICARGVRSRRLAEQLSRAGFKDVRDVPEGMLGSGAGTGWLRKGLPVTSPKADT